MKPPEATVKIPTAGGREERSNVHPTDTSAWMVAVLSVGRSCCSAELRAIACQKVQDPPVKEVLRKGHSSHPRPFSRAARAMLCRLATGVRLTWQPWMRCLASCSPCSNSMHPLRRTGITNSSSTKVNAVSRRV